MLDKVGCTGQRSQQAEIGFLYSNAGHYKFDTESRTHLSMFSLLLFDFCFPNGFRSLGVSVDDCGLCSATAIELPHLLLAGCARICGI